MPTPRWEGKAKKARDYDLAGAELWLLVVCETHGELRQSHIFPQGEDSVAVLDADSRNRVRFCNGPFRRKSGCCPRSQAISDGFNPLVVDN